MDINASSGQFYQSPAAFVVEIEPEGILCASGDEQTESLGENLGSWGY